MFDEKIEKVRKMMYGVPGSTPPVFLDMDESYVCEYAKVNHLKATWDYHKILCAYETFLNDFDHDVNSAPYWISPLRSQILGSRTWIQNCKNGTMQHPEVNALMEDEYDLLIEDPMKCFIEFVLPRMYKKLEGKSKESEFALVKAYMFDKIQSDDFYGKAFDLSYKCSSPVYYGASFYAPFDLLADHLRGITQISLDIRRHKEQVKKACEVLSDFMIRYVECTLPQNEAVLPLVCCFVHLPPMIGVKQFDMFFWPTFKKVCGVLVEKGYHLSLQFQGDYQDNRYLDYYEQLPKDKIMMTIEKQNFEKTVNTLGKEHMISCSYPMEYLTHYPIEKCIDKAKELLDVGLDSGNRFYFGLSKPPLTLNDADPEKMRKLFQFVYEYLN